MISRKVTQQTQGEYLQYTWTEYGHSTYSSCTLHVYIHLFPSFSVGHIGEAYRCPTALRDQINGEQLD